MATKRPSFEKMERDRNKRAKQAAKREKRQSKGDDDVDGDGDEASAAAPKVDESAVLAQLETLHQRFDAEEIDFDTFEERRAELLGLLTQD